MKIGVFDSGIGGKAVATRLQELIPNAEIISVDDHRHVPYGSRPNAEIISLTQTAIQPLIDAECDVIVIACNTATTVAINHLREMFPLVPFVGIEPMIKPAAALTITKKITVLATPATLASARYKELKKLWANNVHIDEPDCNDWAELIEANRSKEVPIAGVVRNAIDNGSDVIVLACTHYHYLTSAAVATAEKRATILEPSDAIARRIKTILSYSGN
ncbi:MAG: glutamate racemase [Candidatus Microsaccharimonas sp.]